MAIAISDVRTAIQDKAKVIPPTSSPPEFLGAGDGATTSFFLRAQNAILPSNGGAMIVSFGTITSGVMTYQQIAPNDATYPWTITGGSWGTPVISFTTAPPVGKTVCCRYTATMFSDAEIQSYITRSAAYATDRLTLMGVQADLIGAILMSDDKFRIYTMGDTKSDPTVIRAALTDQRNAIKSELMNPAVTAAPAIAFGSSFKPPYIR